MSKERFTLLNIYNFNDNFFDNENKRNLDSLDVVRILNHYDKTLGEFIKRDVEQKDKIADLKTKLTLTEKALEIAIFELDFYKNHSQSTNAETYERIINLRNEVIKRAKEIMKSE